MQRRNEITTFFHCRRCLESKPANQSPREWALLEVGLTADGAIQVWCKRHELNVAHTDDLEEIDLVCDACTHERAPD